MKKRGLLLILVFILFSFNVFGAPSPPPCEQYGLQGVEFCGSCYNCGESDGVCPQLFGVDCVDPDCEGKL